MMRKSKRQMRRALTVGLFTAIRWLLVPHEPERKRPASLQALILLVGRRGLEPRTKGL